MSVGVASLHKAIRNAWMSWGLNDSFKMYYSPEDKTLFPTLHDGEATPKQPFPYCVYQIDDGNVNSRMTGHTSVEKHRLEDITASFYIHTKAAGTKSAKEFGALLLEELLAKFGGHPTTSPYEFGSIDNGQVVLCQYQRSMGMRTGDEEHRWEVEYLFQVDFPERT